MPARAGDSGDVQVIVARLQGMHETLELVLAEQRKTNGRVTALETAGAVQKALAERVAAEAIVSRERHAWVPGSVTVLVCTVVGFLLAHYVG